MGDIELLFSIVNKNPRFHTVGKRLIPGRGQDLYMRRYNRTAIHHIVLCRRFESKLVDCPDGVEKGLGMPFGMGGDERRVR